jgi:hypothetical protein
VQENILSLIALLLCECECIVFNFLTSQLMLYCLFFIFARQMLRLIYLRKLMSQLLYLLLDGYMKLSNPLTLRMHKIGNVLLTSLCYSYMLCKVLTYIYCSWWALVEKSCGVLQSYPKQLPFYTDFDQVLVLII